MKRLLILVLVIVAGCTAVNKATKFYDQGDYDTAIEKCQAILEKDSTNAEVYYLLGRCYRAKGDLDESIDMLKQAYSLTPATATTPKAKRGLIAVQMQVADSLYNAQKYWEALKGYKYVYELDSLYIPGISKIANSYYEAGQLTKARDHFQKILQFDENNQPAIMKIRQIDYRMEDAQEDYEIGVEKFEKYQYESAVRYLENALQSEPDHYDAQYYRALAKGSILYNKGHKNDLWDAIELFGKAMVLRPDSGEPHYYLAIAYEKKDRRDFYNAIQEYQNYLKKEPDGRFAEQSRKKIKELTELRDRLQEFWGK